MEIKTNNIIKSALISLSITAFLIGIGVELISNIYYLIATLILFFTIAIVDMIIVDGFSMIIEKIKGRKK